MDFGEILEIWEKQSARREKGEAASATCMDRDGVYDKDSAFLRKERAKGERRYRLFRKKPDDFIDLHGLSQVEAWTALEVFFENSRREGYEKVLIIHGKGNHGNAVLRNLVPQNSASQNDGSGEGALRDLSRRFIESCAFAGESGYSSAREGGTGATWVILKEREKH